MRYLYGMTHSELRELVKAAMPVPHTKSMGDRAMEVWCRIAARVRCDPGTITWGDTNDPGEFMAIPLPDDVMASELVTTDASDEEGEISTLASLHSMIAEVESIKATIEGMKALNAYRMAREETIAYGEDEFFKAGTELLAISKQMISLTTKGKP